MSVALDDVEIEIDNDNNNEDNNINNISNNSAVDVDNINLEGLNINDYDFDDADEVRAPDQAFAETLLQNETGMPNQRPDESLEDYNMRRIGYYMENAGLDYEEAKTIVESEALEFRKQMNDKKIEMLQKQNEQIERQRQMQKEEREARELEKSKVMSPFAKVLKFMQLMRLDNGNTKKYYDLVSRGDTSDDIIELPHDEYVDFQDYLFDKIASPIEAGKKVSNNRIVIYFIQKHPITTDDVSAILDKFSHTDDGAEEDYEYNNDDDYDDDQYGGKKKQNKSKKTRKTAKKRGGKKSKSTMKRGCKGSRKQKRKTRKQRRC